MDYFPVFMNLVGQEVLVVGGGTVAARKIRLLLKAGACVRVVADQLSDEVAAWHDSGAVDHLSCRYTPAHLEGVRLVFAATDDAQLNRCVYRDAETRNVPVNVVDDLAHCRFISPAVVDRSPLQVAVSTGGASPILARMVRGRIEQLLPTGLGPVAAVLREMRKGIRRSFPIEVRRRFWESLLDWGRLVRWSNRPAAAIRREIQNASRQFSGGEGMVYLVGAGPGRPDLLTLRALEVLGSADVILHDRLVSDDILDLARRDADRIYVGKAAGRHHCQQEQIHRILMDEAAAGKTVVRLKGGDPFVFGRGGEELEALHSAGIPYEVVPGITAAVGCAAFAGIPLTHREHANALTFITGHLATGRESGDVVDWRAAVGEGRTAVVYMGIGQAGALRDGLLESGVSADLPVALIEDGSRDSQRVLHGTVGGIPGLAAQVRPGHPGLLVIGQVAALGSTLGWFQTRSTIKNAA